MSTAEAPRLVTLSVPIGPLEADGREVTAAEARAIPGVTLYLPPLLCVTCQECGHEEAFSADTYELTVEVYDEGARVICIDCAGMMDAALREASA